MQVTQYTWEQDSAIQRMDMQRLESGGFEAFIHAPDGAGAGALAEIPAQLAQKGFSSVADNIDGQDVLRVTGFKKESDVLGALSESGITKGEPQTQVSGEKEHKPFVDKVRKHTVKLSGLFGIVGHAALGTVGVLQGDSKRVATSAFYATSTLTSAIYGAGVDGGAEQIVQDMKQYLRKQGVEIPQGDNLTPDELAKKGGVIDTLHNYVKKHPLEIGNTVGLMGNMMLTYSGLKGGDKIEPARTAAGLASMLGALTIILVKEKSKDAAGKFEWPGLEDVPGVAAEDLTPEQLEQQQEKRSPLRKLTDFVQEKPMRTAGLLHMGGNVAMFADAQAIHKHAKEDLQALDDRIAASDGAERDALLKGYDKEKLKGNATGLLAFTTAATYMIATTFTSLSSKTKVSDYNEQEMLGKLCAMSARFIAAQPQEMREDVIDKVATFISKKPEITESREGIIDTLNEKIDALSQSPWAAKVSHERLQSAARPDTQTLGI